MAPSMHLSGDDIVEVSLLEPGGEKLWASSTLEEEAVLLGKEFESPENPKATSLLKYLEISELM